jgi:hypothetical protein
MVYTPDGDNIKLLLDNGPFDHERGRKLILAIATTVAEKYPVTGSGRRAAIVAF